MLYCEIKKTKIKERICLKTLSRIRKENIENETIGLRERIGKTKKKRESFDGILLEYEQRRNL